MFANNYHSKPFENESLNYRKKNYSFTKSSKEKRNISPYLNNQNYSFSNQNKKTINNDNFNYNLNRSNNDLQPQNRIENPLVFLRIHYFEF